MGSKVEGFRNPHNLPTKVCKRCGRLFHWRKKWARSWPEVQYCSVACRSERASVSRVGVKNSPERG